MPYSANKLEELNMPKNAPGTPEPKRPKAPKKLRQQVLEHNQQCASNYGAFLISADDLRTRTDVGEYVVFCAGAFTGKSAATEVEALRIVQQEELTGCGVYPIRAGAHRRHVPLALKSKHSD